MLSHLKVVELADDLGAYTGRILAELGAQVTKIEAAAATTPAIGARCAAGAATPASPGSPGTPARRRAALDLDTAEGLAGAEALLKDADILVQGGADRLAALGLDYGRLSAANPGLISVIVAPFAEGGDT